MSSASQETELLLDYREINRGPACIFAVPTEISFSVKQAPPNLYHRKQTLVDRLHHACMKMYQFPTRHLHHMVPLWRSHGWFSGPVVSRWKLWP